MILKYFIAAAALVALSTPSFAQDALPPIDCNDPANAQEDECAVLLPPAGTGAEFATLAPAAAAVAVLGVLAISGGGGGGNNNNTTTTTSTTGTTD
ncbi:hypothetical protein SAMN04488515_3150 [Cognatiyoonia koreensis]|uniref:Uncharacterized protein n=1 Tax=Cognatiyoonia koreensis TaxID=364200 RepID=A0A1I0RRV4_9RHOB|nr:hypothetical protein [Cognatiyoonia koreensis]SEW44062.1 hypothetical protein SAMN04488515_3150 [Cognatiyoonia koreensis]